MNCKNKGLSKIFFHIDKETVFLAIGILLTISYYINPLDNTDINEWNRTFSTAVLSGISIDSRIGNFYLLFFFILPIIFILLMTSLSFLFKYRRKYKDFFIKFCIFSFVITVVSLISRYSVEGYEIKNNLLIQIILGFWILISVIAIIDKNEELDFSDSILCFLTYINTTLLLSMLFSFKRYNYEIIISCLIIGIVFGLLIKLDKLKRIKKLVKNFLYLMMWMPAFLRLELEGIYWLVEKGHGLQRYFTHIIRLSVVCILLFCIIAYLAFKLKKDVTGFGYIGFIVSISALAFFTYKYQYTWSYGSYAEYSAVIRPPIRTSGTASP